MFQADYSGNLSGSDNNVEVVDEDSNAKEQQDGKKYDRNVDWDSDSDNDINEEEAILRQGSNR